MNERIRAKVVHMLENYLQNVRKIAQLHYELEHPKLVSSSEIIEAMSFAKSPSEGSRSVSCVSDKTPYTAMNYQKTAERLNMEVSGEIVEKLIPLEQETDRLRYYVTLLEAKQSLVIRKHYFEVCSWEEVSEELKLTTRALYKVRNKAIAALVEMYEFAGLFV